MTRKSYTEIQEELRHAQQYIWILIHDDTYGVINAKAYPHEYEKVKHTVKSLAVVQVAPEHNPDKVKRALHVRHPGAVLIAQPIPNHFVCLLAHDPESWCVRVKATMNKYKQPYTMAWTYSTGNPNIDFLTCLELIQLTNPQDITQTLKEIPQ